MGNQLEFGSLNLAFFQINNLVSVNFLVCAIALGYFSVPGRVPGLAVYA